MRFVDNQISDKSTGIIHTDTGEMKLSRNNILYTEVGIDSSTFVTVEKRNNVYGNTIDYLDL